jgi:PIN like domain
MEENRPHREQPSQPTTRGQEEQTSKPRQQEVQRQAVTRLDRDFDVLHEKSIFPEPVEVFAFRPATVAEIKDAAIAVLDANALLLPFTHELEQQTLDEIERIYEKLISERRLVIPAQAAREFAKHRSHKVADMYSAIARRKSSLPTTKGETFRLWESVEQYDRMISLQREVSDKLGQYNESIDNMLRFLKNWSVNDPISELYRRLFTEEVVITPELEDREIKDEWYRRKIHGIPPGYKDKETEIGDLLIWYTILKIGREREQSVIFVSGDRKADWRVRASRTADAGRDPAKETDRDSFILYPRYELVEEFRRESGGCTFQILQLHEFLAEHGASADAIASVRQAEVRAESQETSQLRILLPSNLSMNATLRQIALDLVAKLRTLIDEDLQAERELKHTYHEAISRRRSEGERNIEYDKYIDDVNEAHKLIEQKYSRLYKVEARLLRDEMLTRVVGNVVREQDVDRWYESGGSGFIIERIASDLEYLAHHIPD